MSASATLGRNWPDQRSQRPVDINTGYTGIERRNPTPTPAQIAESERRAERRFDAVPTPLTNFGAFA